MYIATKNFVCSGVTYWKGDTISNWSHFWMSKRDKANFVKKGSIGETMNKVTNAQVKQSYESHKSNYPAPRSRDSYYHGSYNEHTSSVFPTSHYIDEGFVNHHDTTPSHSHDSHSHNHDSGHSHSSYDSGGYDSGYSSSDSSSCDSGGGDCGGGDCGGGGD